MRWDFPKQTILGFGKENGERIGDCFRCCIAAVLQRPAIEVPHFVEIGEQTGKSADALAQKWLHEQGYWLLKSDVTSLYGPPFYISRYAEDPVDVLPVICCGPTVRSKKPTNTHCVVMDGETVLYDPHPSEAGLLAVTSRYLIVPHLE